MSTKEAKARIKITKCMKKLAGDSLKVKTTMLTFNSKQMLS